MESDVIIFAIIKRKFRRTSAEKAPRSSKLLNMSLLGRFYRSVKILEYFTVISMENPSKVFHENFMKISSVQP